LRLLKSDEHFTVIIFRIFWTGLISAFVMLLRIAKYFRP
jgi:WD40 repeat protein